MNYFHTFDEMAEATGLQLYVEKHPHYSYFDRIVRFTIPGLPELRWDTNSTYLDDDSVLMDKEKTELLAVVNRIIGGMATPDKSDTLGQLRYLAFCMTCSLENAPPDAAQAAVDYLEGYLASLKASRQAVVPQSTKQERIGEEQVLRHPTDRQLDTARNSGPS